MKYKIYIPTKGRYDKLLTADYLVKNGIDFSLVVEKKEVDLYKEKYPNKIIALPDSDYGGVYFARNFIKKLSIKNGEKRHWQLDDDIKKLVYVNDGKFIDMPLDKIFGNMENFCDKFKNIGLASPHSTVWVKFGKKPFEINKLAYSCLLINNNLDICWNKDVMEDIDYNIQVLESGWCTIRFYLYSFAWSARTSQKGGVTEFYLNKNKRFNAVKNTQEKWNLGKIIEKSVSGNTIYTVQFANKFREYNQKLRPDFDGKYLKRAREVTQEFIETYGGNWAYIDILDRMIAEAIEKEIGNWLEELYVQ
jgi:hypothetical protein